MAISKVIYGNQTLIDITDTNASATSVQTGKKFYNSAGEAVTGIGSALGHETEVLPNGGIVHHIIGVDLGEDTVDAGHLFTGYTAHTSNGILITGTMTGPPLKMGVVRPDAELIQTWTYDKLWVTDDSGTIPDYTTTATTIYTGSAISPTYTLAVNLYRYFILFRCLTIPIYNTDIKEQGRQDYSITSGAYEIGEIEANTFSTLDGVKFSSRSTNIFNGMAGYRMPYWQSDNKIGVYTGTTYGIHQTMAGPTISSSTSASPVITIKDPNLIIRGSTTYLTSSAWSKIIDIRRQYVIELYRITKETDQFNGWGLHSQMLHIINCVDTVNHKLT